MAKTGFQPLQWLIYVAARVMIGGLGRLPVGLGFRLGRFAGAVAWRLYPGRRRITVENLRRVHRHLDGDAPPEPELRRRAREVFRRAGANLVCSFRFVCMPAGRMLDHVEVEGLEAFLDGMPEDRGVLLVIGHMGPWEILSQVSALLRDHGVEKPVGALYRPVNSVYIDRWFLRDRTRRGTRLFSRREGFLGTKEFLRRGGILGILSDQRAGRGPEAPFFGCPAKSTPLPGILHQSTGAPFRTLSISTVGPARWRLRLVCPPQPEAADLEDRDAMARYVNRVLESVLSDSVLDGFWVHDRFRIGPAMKRGRPEPSAGVAE